VSTTTRDFGASGCAVEVVFSKKKLLLVAIIVDVDVFTAEKFGRLEIIFIKKIR
jgi:hypothetical protein